jgi:hypothetical protein
MGWQRFLLGNHTGKEVLKREAKLYVGNLSRAMTREALNLRFAKTREVAAAEVIKDRKSDFNMAAKIDQLL